MSSLLSSQRDAWRCIVREKGLTTQLLEAYEQGGEAAVIALVAGFGLVPDPSPPGPVLRLRMSGFQSK